MKYGVKINGMELGGTVYDVETALHEYPEVTLPKDVYRRDSYWDLFKRQDRYVKETGREVGSLTLTIYTQKIKGAVERGRTKFEEMFILPLTKQVIIPVELEETGGVIYNCTLTSNIVKQNIHGRTGIFTYVLEFGIEWIERRVVDDEPLTFKEYPLDPTKSYYIIYKTDRHLDEFSYTLKKGVEQESELNYIHKLYDGVSIPIGEVEVNTLTHVVTDGDRLVGVFTKPVPLITGYDSVNIFSYNSGGLVTIREVV